MPLKEGFLCYDFLKSTISVSGKTKIVKMNFH
jgi:hypothetical protein